jgi:cytokinin dehydrogenase
VNARRDISNGARRDGLTRRAAITGATAAVALASGAVPAQAGGRRPRPPALDGELRCDVAARSAAADDFGHIVERAPECVLVAESADDLAATIRWAARRGRRFAARGQGHSTFGRSQVQDGIVADMSRLRRIGPVRDDRVVVEAGARWSELLAVTLAQGRTPPVLTDYLELSVGGTLAVGGVGGTSMSIGVQTDHVLELEVVTGEGELVTCSATRNADLFDAVRAGLGQVALITRATLRLVAAPSSVRRFQLFYPDLAAMLDDARTLASERRFDAVQGAIVAPPSGGRAFRLDAARFFDDPPPDDGVLLAGLSDDPARRVGANIPYLDYLRRLAPLEATLRENGQWFLPHPWLTTFVGDSRVEDVVAAELDRLDPPADLGPFGQVVVSPIGRAGIGTPLLRMPADALSWAFNLIRIPPTGDAGEATRLVRANRATYRRVADAGGVLYPVSALPLSPRGWRRHFGPAFAALAEAKRRNDPCHTLTPGYEVFEG